REFFQETAGYKHLHVLILRQVIDDVQRIANDGQLFKVAKPAGDLEGSGTRIQDDGVVLLDQGNGLLSDAPFGIEIYAFFLGNGKGNITGLESPTVGPDQ